MKLLVLCGSPRKGGVVSRLLAEVARAAEARYQISWIDTASLEMRHCTGCMRCRPDGPCVLPPDDAHQVGRMIAAADALLVGTPTHWGNMSSTLKTLFDRNVPVLMGEKPSGMPLPRHKGKPAAVVTACSTPWPFNWIAAESRGALRAVGEVLHYAGFRVRGRLVMPGSKKKSQIPPGLLKKAAALGGRL